MMTRKGCFVFCFVCSECESVIRTKVGHYNIAHKSTGLPFYICMYATDKDPKVGSHTANSNIKRQIILRNQTNGPGRGQFGTTEL